MEQFYKVVKVEVPTGYKLKNITTDGKDTKDVVSGNALPNSNTVIVHLDKIPTNTVTTEVVDKETGKVISDTTKTYTGLDGSKITVKIPNIPKGYHLVKAPTNIPSVMPNKNETIKWVAEKDTVTVNATYVNGEGNIVEGGTFTIGKDKVVEGKDGSNKVIEGDIIPTVTASRVPNGYKIVGNESITVTGKDGQKVEKVVQKVEKVVQKGGITVTVINGKTKKPLVGATVKVEGKIVTTNSKVSSSEGKTSEIKAKANPKTGDVSELPFLLGAIVAVFALVANKFKKNPKKEK